MSITELIAKAPLNHRVALDWFKDNAGKELPWTPLLPGGMRLFCTPKGIYKPEGSEHALTVRQTLKTKYPDREPIFRDDGSWTYFYHQEKESEAELDYFTNRALLACMKDRIPVGVARQTSAKPNTKYFILGLALVENFKNGFFQFEGFSSGGEYIPNSIDGPDTEYISDLESKVEQQSPFDPHELKDAKERIFREIALRRGQKKFRSKLLRIYGGRCAISGCEVEAALEAAHITPYMGPATNSSQNGILLRADIHTLWDLGLIAIDPESLQVGLGQALMGTSYQSFCGKTPTFPNNPEDKPSIEAIKSHYLLASKKS